MGEILSRGSAEPPTTGTAHEHDGKVMDFKETDLTRLCKADHDACSKGYDDKPDWKCGAELRDNLSARMNTYGLVMALLITLTFGQDPPGTIQDSLWRADQVENIQSWYLFF